MSECCVGVFVLKLCNKKKGFTKIKQPRIYKTHISDIIFLILGCFIFLEPHLHHIDIIYMIEMRGTEKGGGGVYLS